MHARFCLAALVGMLAGLFSHGYEVLVSREAFCVERWRVSDDGSQWEKRGDFLVADGEMRPTGLTAQGDVIYVGDSTCGGRIRVYGRDGGARGVLATLGHRPDQLCVSADGKYLYVTVLDKGVFRFSTADGKGGLFLDAPGAGMRGITFGGDGFLYVCCRTEASVRVYDVSHGSPELKGKIAAHGCTGGFGFFDAARLAVFGVQAMLLDLSKPASAFLGAEKLLANAIGVCRIGTCVFAGDWASGKVWRFDSRPDVAPTCVAQGVRNVCALLPLDEQAPLPPPRSQLKYRSPPLPEESGGMPFL